MEDQNQGGSDYTKKQMTTVIAAVAIILAALFLARVFQDDQPSDAENAADQLAGEQEGGEGTSTTQARLSTSFTRAEAFADRKEAEFVINSTQGKPTAGVGAEKIMDGVIQDEEDALIHYFATSALDAKGEANFVGVYRYNIQSNRWWRMYKATYEEEPLKSLHVIGKEGRKLILAVDSLERERKACDSLWLLGDLVSVDMDDAYAGFTGYQPPASVLQAEQTLQTECLASDDA